MSAPVFLAADLTDAAPGAPVTLRGEEARHATTVRRIRVGETVELVDGRGTRVRGPVSSTQGELTITVDTVEVEPPPAVRLTLVQALAKGGRDEQAVETATEVGIDEVVPWQSERCVSVWAGKKAGRGRERWQAVALAATKQSRRARLPEVAELVVGRALLDRVARIVDDGGTVLVLHEEADQPLRSVPLPTYGEVAVVVGPEGGLSPREVSELRDRGAAVVRLGPHVLRSSTAGPIATALLAQALGRWG